MADAAPEMKVCLNFTGDEPCDEHKNSFVPYFGFTGRICTPSFAENPVFPRGSDLSLRKDRLYGTKPTLPKLRDRQRQAFVVAVETLRAFTDSLFRARHRRPRPIPFLKFLSQSIGARRTAVSVHFSALGGMFLRRASRPQDTLILALDFNRRIFSVLTNVSWKWGSVQAIGFPLSFSSSWSISYHK